jgi:1-phosphofructokinase
MIVTLTPNPSLDRTIEVPRLVRGEVLRATATRIDPGGKGVNVARALLANGFKAVAVVPSGGVEGGQLGALLAAEGIEAVPVAVSGAVRANVSVVEPDGTVTKLNEPGPRLSAAELEALVAATADAAQDAEWVVASGSLPPGAPTGFYADLVQRLRPSGALTAVDTSGPALVAALAARPDLIKPNREELAEATRRPIRTLGDAVAGARQLRAAGARAVLVSLGPDGAVLVDEVGAVHCEAPVPERRSPVGAGDATLAGFIAAGGAGPQALAEALAWGAAAAGLVGSRMPRPEDLDRAAVRLHPDPDLDRVLEGQH